MSTNKENMDNKKSLFKSLKDKKSFEIILVIILIIIVLIIFMTNFTENGNSNVENAFTDYCKSEEKKAEEILSKIKGAGKVKICITYESGVEKIYANKTVSKTSGSITTVTEELIYNSGKPVLIKETAPKIRGVIVVAEGASNASVRLEIIRAVIALYKVSPASIEVFSSK